MLHALFIKMSNNNDKLEILKLKLNSATKLKLNSEREVLKLRNREREFTEELCNLKAEITLFGEQLEGLKDQIAQTKHQISMIEICKTSEEAKVAAHIDNLNNHRNRFQGLFEKERNQTELRKKEIKDKEKEEEELMRQQVKQVADKNEQQAREAAEMEKECETVERECCVLKKRNNAIMLKLRRKLLEAENARRELMNRIGDASKFKDFSNPE